MYIMYHDDLLWVQTYELCSNQPPLTVDIKGMSSQ